MLGSTKPVQREQHGRAIYLKIWLAAYYTAFFLLLYFYYLRYFVVLSVGIKHITETEKDTF